MRRNPLRHAGAQHMTAQQKRQRPANGGAKEHQRTPLHHAEHGATGHGQQERRQQEQHHANVGGNERQRGPYPEGLDPGRKTRQIRRGQPADRNARHQRHGHAGGTRESGGGTLEGGGHASNIPHHNRTAPA